MTKHLEMFGNHKIISESREFLEFVIGLDYVNNTLGFGKLREGSYTKGGLEIKSIGYDMPRGRLKIVIRTEKFGMQEVYVMLPIKKVPQFKKDVLDKGYNFVVN